jgi:DNA mismatch endonuclease (patch repair protein)
MDTKPGPRVRQRLHALGFRFRLHRRDLPGTPDIVLPRHRAAIQVHGCFWHQHPGCRHATKPRTRQDYWLPSSSET